MSRSNAPAAHPGTQPGGWPQQRPAAQQAPQAAQQSNEQAIYEQDLAAWNAQQQGRWPPAAQAAAPAYAPPQAGYPPADNAPRTAPPAYHYPSGTEGYDPYSRPTHSSRETTAPPSAHGHGYGGQPYGAAPGQQAYPQQSYAPEFDPYTPPMPQSAPAPGYGAQPGYGHVAPPPAYGGTHYAEPAPAYSPAGQDALSSLQRTAPAAPELRGAHYEQGFEQWSPPAYQPPQAAPDPRGYDLGGYATAAVEPAAYRQQLPVDQGHAQGHAEWGHHEPYPPQGQYDTYGQGHPFPQHHGHPQGGFDPAAQAHDPNPQQHAGGQLEPAYQHDEAGAEYELEEAPAGRRWGLIAAALVGAIAVGSGLAYGYKMIYGPGTAIAAAPVVKNTGVPTKVKPAEPGGKQFAHTDSKIMGRLNDQSASASSVAAPAAASADSDPNGARKVQTVVIGRDGAIVPPAAPPAAPPAPALAPPSALGGPQPVNVPGMTIVDGFGGRPPTAALAAAPAPPSAAPSPARPVVVNPPAAAPAAAAVPAKPTVLARATPTSVSDAAPVAVTKPAAAKAPVPKKVVAAVSPSAAAVPAATGGNGYVAVLASVPASQKSSMDALKQFADMQQKFGTALANKTPEVREANLGDKGTYHRLLVGPPSSREQAGQLCSQLKAAGYGSCWVTAY